MKHRFFVYSLLCAFFLALGLPVMADKKRGKNDGPESPSIQDSKLYFSDRVFAAPSRPFMQRIKTDPADAPIVVTGLPEGLHWNADLRRVEGRVTAPGTYHYSVNLILTDRADSALVPHDVTLTVNERYAASRPVMGWISWNVFEGDISDKVVRATADQLDQLGLKEAGYNYLIIDDLWHAPARNSDGTPKEDPAKFPQGMKAAVDYVHSKGLKFGIYSDAAEKTCAGAFGSYGYEKTDATQYALWGVDLLKYDYCHAPTEVGEALSRDCWKGKPGGIGVLQSIDLMKDLWPYGGVHRYNDADMMCVGIHGKGKSSSDLCATGSGMTQDEYRTQFALWCMWSSPLLISFDLSQPISEDDRAMITNKELIDLNQDELAQPAEFVGQYGNLYYFQKPLSNGDVAIAVTNVGDKEEKFRLEFDRFSLAKGLRAFKVRDCQQRTDVGAVKGGFDTKVRSHATLVFRLSENIEIANIVRRNLKKTLGIDESNKGVSTMSSSVRKRKQK